MAASSPKPEAVTIDVQKTTNQADNSINESNPNVKEYKALYDAVLANDWKGAAKFLETRPDGLTAPISSPDGRTALSVAAMEGHSDIVEKLAKLMPKESLAKQDSSGWPAIGYAVVDGNMKSVKAILKEDPMLAQTEITSMRLLHHALVYSDGQEKVPVKTKPKSKKICWLLAVLTKEDVHVDAAILGGLICAGYFDICLYLLEQYPNAISLFEEISSLIVGLISLWSQFPSGSRMGFWEAFIYKFVPIYTSHTPQKWLKEEVKLISESLLIRTQSNASPRINGISHVIRWIKRLLWRIVSFLVPSLKYIRYKKKKHMYALKLIEDLFNKLADRDFNDYEKSELLDIIELASEVGTVEVVKAFYKFFPDMLWSRTPLVLKNAIEKRHDQIFSLFNGINGRNKVLFMKISMPNICYSAAKLSPHPKLLAVSGAAFQIQRELQWFEEVNKLMAPFVRNTKELEGKPSPREEFIQEHENLRKEAEVWMKDTSNYSMVVAALIATIAFAAAFTVPGGTNGDTGVPIYIKENSFLVFVIFNALALFSSITSLVMFLSILTSRFEMEDFLRSLPKRVILGLASLFFCFASMLVAFGAGLFIILEDKWEWAYIPIILLASFPGLMFVILQLPLFINMIQSTYGRGVFSPKKIW